MKVKQTYPSLPKRRLQRERIVQTSRGPLLIAAFLTVLVNAAVGGKAWSVVTVWSLWMVWTLLIATDMVEYNRIRQSVKLIGESCVLLILIDCFLVSGWALDVVAIVYFSALIAVSILLFTDYERQRHNLLPALLMAFVGLGAAVLCMLWLNEPPRWQLIVMGGLSFAVLIICLWTMGGDIPNELKKMFHTR